MSDNLSINNIVDDNISSQLNSFPRFFNISYNLSKTLREKLQQNNLKLKSEILLLSDNELKTKYGFDSKDIEEINKKIKNLPTNILRKCNKISESEYIRTGCNGFDNVFGGYGLPTRKVIQISGEAGVGKSQICSQLCFRTQLDKSEGGLNGEVLYFDTEDGFRPERINEIAFNYFRKYFTEQSLLDFKTEEVLTRVHVRKVNHNADDLCNIILNGQLESFLDYHLNVRLFVLDSISYHFRYDYDYNNDYRTHQLLQIASKLKQIAFERNIAILITNQVKLSNQPALGFLWNSTCSTSLLLKRDFSHFSEEPTNNDHNEDNNRIKSILSIRQCCVLKSPIVSDSTKFEYIITKLGVEDRIQ